jgi:hypothetical protein
MGPNQATIAATSARIPRALAKWRVRGLDPLCGGQFWRGEGSGIRITFRSQTLNAHYGPPRRPLIRDYSQNDAAHGRVSLPWVRDVKREGSLVFAGNGGFLSVGVHQAERCWLRKTTRNCVPAPLESHPPAVPSRATLWRTPWRVRKKVARFGCPGWWIRMCRFQAA